MRSSLWFALAALLITAVGCGKESTSEPNESPDIDVTPSSLSMTAQTGRDTTATLTVSNVGNAALNVTSITGNQTWLRVSPTNFSVSAGASRDLTVTANASGLSAETYMGTITIVSIDPDEATKTVGVTFTVTGGSAAQVEMVWINGGPFGMGSNSSWALDSEKPVHTVTVSSFYMAKYEVTQAQYQAVMGTNPSWFRRADRPVESLSWYDAAQFCNALSAREGRTKFYNDDDLNRQASTVRMNWGAFGYRLPTEAEWEYACRAGTTTDFYNGDLRYPGCEPLDPALWTIGWYCGNSSDQTLDVGTKQPNAWSLYDMSGNVQEWCNDWYGSYSSGAQTDPTGPSSGSSRVFRGGSWILSAQECRSASRNGGGSGERYSDVGFRVVWR